MSKNDTSIPPATLPPPTIAPVTQTWPPVTTLPPPTIAPPASASANIPGPNKDYNFYDRMQYEGAKLEGKILPDSVLKWSTEQAQAAAKKGLLGMEATADAFQDVAADRAAKSGLPTEVDKKPADTSKGNRR